MSSIQIASRLLDVERRKGTLEEKRIRTFPPVLALLNLFFCAYCDQYLQHDVEGHYLSLFIFVECATLTLLSIGSFMRTGQEILVKTSVLPTTQWSVLLFVFFGFVRKPASMALFLTTELFFVVLSVHSFFLTVTAGVLYLLLFLNVLLLTALICTKLARVSRPVAGFAVACVLLFTLLPASSLIFHLPSLVGSIPFIAWTARGILAAQRSQTVLALFNGSYMLLSLAAMLFLSKRYS